MQLMMKVLVGYSMYLSASIQNSHLRHDLLLTMPKLYLSVISNVLVRCGGGIAIQHRMAYQGEIS